MTSPQGIVLTPEERLARRRLILRDTVSLLTLFLITVVIFTLTWLLHRSFVNHEQTLGERWKARGEAALAAGRPAEAVEALRSALAYVPNRETEIELATALEDAGRTTEAVAYFNTLRDSAPGDGYINLQLARLAAKQGHEQAALLDYAAALDGTWQGNGYDRRRAVRLEMAQYLLARHHPNQAQTQLLIAASNAPADPAVQLPIAVLLEQAQDPQDALKIYRHMAAEREAPADAAEGAGRVAYQLGQYRMAADYLARALAGPQANSLPADRKAADRNMLATAQQVLAVFPSLDLRPYARAERILAARTTARNRLTSCSAANPGAPTQLASLLSRWDQLPKRMTARDLEQDPDEEQTVLQLTYDTETQTAHVCGAPSGEDAVLLRIAQNPSAVEQE